jgi:hypothetical protein
MSSIFGSSGSGSISFNSNKDKSNSYSAGTSKYQELTQISTSKYISTPAQLTINGALTVSCDAGYESAGAENDNMAMANGYLALMVKVFSDSSLSNCIFTNTVAAATAGASKSEPSSGSTDVENSENTVKISSQKVMIPAGYVVFYISESAQDIFGDYSFARLIWGSDAGTTFSATYSSQVYASRYFANGFCLGAATDNYVAAFRDSSGNMNFVAQNPSYGFQVTSSGIQYRIGSNSWKTLVSS